MEPIDDGPSGGRSVAGVGAAVPASVPAVPLAIVPAHPNSVGSDHTMAASVGSRWMSPFLGGSRDAVAVAVAADSIEHERHHQCRVRDFRSEK